MAMRYRLLGQTGLRVSELFLGTMTFGVDGWGTPTDECGRLVDTYADAGGNVLDTANFYGDGRSESILGELLRGRRDRFVLTTKFTVTRDGTDPNSAGSHRKNLRLSLEASLRRLRTDHLDVYWVNLWDRHTPLEETMRALDDAVRAGTVLYVGISDAPAWVITRADALAQLHDWTRVAAVQAPYSLLQRDVERELLPMAEHLGMTMATWGPLARGVLSGAAGRGKRVAAGSLGAREHTAARAVQEIADELGVSPAQVAVAWTRARSRVVHPILGARTSQQLEDTICAVDVTLPLEGVQRLDAAAPIALGFPSDFLADAGAAVFGEVAGLVEAR
jgi:aryl-alcohol dehydrogenase-like predicted oxidoreductase